MATKIICCSFEPGSMGGFITICNGVKHSLESHFSKTVAVTKEAFIAACKDRILFNDILGVDIRQGWQNALADAILPYQTMTVEEVDPKVAANVSSELDVQIRGEDAVNADIAAVEKENAKLEKAAKKAAKAKAKKDEKPAEPETPAKPTLLEGDQGQPVPQPAEPEHDTTVTEDELAPSAEPVAQEPQTEEVKNGQGTVETTDNGSQDARGESDSELPVDGPRAETDK